MAEENNPAPANAPEEKNQDWTDMIEVRDRGNAASVSGDGDSKILNQEEIDTLFGYSADKEGEDDGYDGPDAALLGDIVISLEKVQEQAEEYGHSFERELAYLTIHGMLHILGYDHMEPDDKAEMRKEEEFILHRLGYVRQGEEL